MIAKLKALGALKCVCLCALCGGLLAAVAGGGYVAAQTFLSSSDAAAQGGNAAQSDTAAQTEEPDAATYEDVLYYDGHSYIVNENIISVLLIGNDENKQNEASEYNGQCDAVVLVVIDTEAATLNMVNIPRDAMALMTVQDTEGNFLREDTYQLALAYAFGADDADSCELTMQAVSNLLWGMEIDYYARLNLSGVAVANDLIGGVTLTLIEDFTDLAYSNNYSDPEMILGETITLTGEQASLYVQYRNRYEDNSSADRIKRQSQYLSAYLVQLKEVIKENPLVVLNYYAALSEYLYTNFPVSQMISLATIVSEITFSSDNLTTLSGESEVVDKFLQLYLDEDETLAVVLDLFYTKIS